MSLAGEGSALIRQATAVLQSRSPAAVGVGALAGLAFSGLAHQFLGSAGLGGLGTLYYVAGGIVIAVLVAIGRSPKLSPAAEATLEYLARTGVHVGPVERAWMHKKALTLFLEETYRANGARPPAPPAAAG